MLRCPDEATTAPDLADLSLAELKVHVELMKDIDMRPPIRIASFEA